MKNQMKKLLYSFALAVCLLGTSGAMAGHWHGHGRWGGPSVFIGVGPGYYNGPYYDNYGPYYHCAWIRGHWNGYGYWIPAHRECWY